jgi:hypothetical protein
MDNVLVGLLLAGFVIGIICSLLGMYFIWLRLRGINTLGEVRGIGEISTLKVGISLLSAGGYFFWHAASTYMPIQRGAELQSKVDALLVTASRELRKEFYEVTKDLKPPITPDKFDRVNFLIKLLLYIDDNNGHGLYYTGEVASREGHTETAKRYFYRYLEAQETVRDRDRGGNTGSEICYERPRGFCRQRSAWIEHWLANQFYDSGQVATDVPQKLDHLERALAYTTAALHDFPSGFEQIRPTKWLEHTLTSEITRLKGN